MSVQSDALRRYFHENGMSNRDVAEKIGKHETTVSNILSGKYGISRDVATRLSEIYGFSIRFLMSGEGLLVPPASERQPATTVVGEISLQAEVESLRDQLRHEREEKARILGIIEKLTEK